MDMVEVIDRKFIFDTRGRFLKVMNGAEQGLPGAFGEIYTVIAGVGESRANHFHQIANEWFTLLSGSANLALVDVRTSAKRVLHLDAMKPVTVRVPPMVAHSFVNTGEGEFLLLAYSDYRYDPADTIAFAFSE